MTRAQNDRSQDIFDSDELGREATVSKMETTAADSKDYQTRLYNLDAILSVGYRVNSKRGTQFRIRATVSGTSGSTTNPAKYPANMAGFPVALVRQQPAEHPDNGRLH
jgi:Virulence protein RhuM family